jgi:6-phosphogluconolactonase
VTALSVHPDGQAASQAAATLLERLIGDAQERRGTAHVSLAGGNTPRRAYELLGQSLEDAEHVEWWFGDERCVPFDDPESNYRLVAESLFSVLPASVNHVHRIAGELAPEEAAAVYEDELLRAVPSNTAGIPQLDAAFLGLGEDGHTASLFPGDPSLDVRNRLAVPVVAVKPPPNRITLTLPVFEAARAVLILATGAGKRDAVARVLAGPDRDTPASLVAGDPLTLIVDEDAAP